MGLFGPSKDEIWRQLSAEMGADFQPGGLFKSGKVTLTHDEWVITLDTYTVSSGESSSTYTRMRAPYVNRDGFRFNIYSKSAFSWLGLALKGGIDIVVGDAFFDDAYVIQGIPAESVKRLLANDEIRLLIESQPDVHLEVKDDEGWFGEHFPEGVDELYFSTRGVIKDKVQLRQLFDLFAAVLDELSRMGSAAESAPAAPEPPQPATPPLLQFH